MLIPGSQSSAPKVRPCGKAQRAQRQLWLIPGAPGHKGQDKGQEHGAPSTSQQHSARQTCPVSAASMSRAGTGAAPCAPTAGRGSAGWGQEQCSHLPELTFSPEHM